LTALAFASSSNAAVESPPPPSVWSDKADYAPGELVTLSGADWAPGEAVHIRVNDDAGETWRRDVDVTADESGALADQFNLPDWFVAVYTVTATGATSGTATWSFTDGNVNIKTINVPSASVDWRLFNNLACTGGSASNGTITATSGGNGTGIPGGATASQSLRLTPGTVTGFAFSQWESGDFTTGDPSTANPVCLRGAGSTQNVKLTYAANTSTAIARTAGTDPSTFGDSLTFRATVTSGSPASAVTEGTVKFFDGGASCSSPGPQIGADQTLNASGQASVSTTTLSVGSHTIRACYQGTVNFGASGNSISQTVNPACTAPSVTTQPTNQSITYGANATFTAAASGSPSPTVKWQVDTGSGFVDMSPAQTSTTLTLTKPTVSMSGNKYRAVFTNNCGGTQTATTSAATLTVNSKSIVITPDSGQGKVYGDSDPVLTYTNSPALETGDSFTGALARAVGENVGSYAINLGTLSAGPNYSLSLSGTVSFTITKAELTVTADDKTKTYGDADPAFTFAYSGFVLGDTGAAIDTPPTCGVAGAHVNAGSYDITCSGGVDNNYSFAYVDGTLTVEKANLDLYAIGDSKVYDATTDSSGEPLVVGLKGSDTVTGLAQRFQSKNVLGSGASTLQIVSGYSVNDGNAGNNYNVTTHTDSGTITKAPLDISAVTDTKVYDGTTSSSGVPTVSGLQGTDSVSGKEQKFQSKNVMGAGNSTLVVTGYTVSDDNSGGNYNVATHTASGTITKAPLDISAVTDTKFYDGTTSSSGVPTVSGLQGTDSVSGKEQKFQSKNVMGTNGSTLEVTAYTVNDGNSGGNYNVTPHTATGTITKKNLTVSGITASNKVWDGNTNAALNVSGASLVGVVSGDAVALNTGAAVGTFASSNVGTWNVAVSGLTISGGDSGNYSLTQPTTTASITAWNANGYGFYAPVGADAAHSVFTAAPGPAPTTKPASMEWNSAKSGSTIPLKFNVFAGNVERTGVTGTFAATPFQTAKLNSCVDSTNEDPVDFTTTGNTSLRYDTTAAQWIQNWATPKVNADTCYRAWVTFADGSSIEAFFKLKK